MNDEQGVPTAVALPWRPRWGLVALALVLTTLSAWSVQQFSVALADDPYYQDYAARPVREILEFGPNDSRSYVLWLHLLSSVFAGDALTVANNLALLWALAGLVFVYTRRRTGSDPAALLAATLVSSSFMGLAVWPKVTHFALVIALAGFLLADPLRDRSSQVAVGAAGLLLASTARPELALGGLAALAVATLLRWKERPGIRNQSLFLLAWLALLGIVAIGQMPLLSGSERSNLALSQHFALNWVSWTGWPADAWHDHDEIWALVFGDADGLLGAFRSNPSVLLHHLQDNALRVALLLVPLSFVPLGVPLEIVPVVANDPGLLPAALVGGLFVLAAAHAVGGLSPGRMTSRAFLWACLVVPCLLAAVVIYPRHHYLLPVSVGLIVWGVVALHRRWSARADWTAILWLLSALWLLVPLAVARLA